MQFSGERKESDIKVIRWQVWCTLKVTLCQVIGEHITADKIDRPMVSPPVVDCVG